jgi:glyoxylase I family protein
MRIEHIAINVPAPNAAAQWYADHLGLKIVRSMDESPHIHFLADTAGQSVLEMYDFPEVDSPNYAAMHPLLFHIALQTEDIEGEIARLVAAGATAASDINEMPNGDRLVFLRDPWGVPLQLVQRQTPLLQNQ